MSTAGAFGTLYVVSTPIGNLGDITLRAIETLRAVALIVAEDTRHSRALLERHEIGTPMESHHEHNEARSTPRLVERLRAGASLALITDAGTPLLSDPGARLVRAALEEGVRVVPIPGASALLAALVASGIDAERFTFFGFLARRGRERREAIEALIALPHTAVLYEAPGRVADTLAEIAGAGGGRRDVVVARELTKQFEELRRGTVETLAMYYADASVRGEVVIVIAGASPAEVDEDALRERARALRHTGVSSRDVTRALMEELGAPRNLAYRIAHE
jgi:16S rRNA (cytidine1402-2'-O)-methyltransferase